MTESEAPESPRPDEPLQRVEPFETGGLPVARAPSSAEDQIESAPAGGSNPQRQLPELVAAVTRVEPNPDGGQLTLF